MTKQHGLPGQKIHPTLTQIEDVSFSRAGELRFTGPIEQSDSI